MRYGLIIPKIQKGDYVQGSRLRLGGVALQPDGQWDAYLPPDELQAQYVETQACATFGTLNAVEILERRVYADTSNYSDRFLAEQSGTTMYGNDPHTVAETLRKLGVCFESDWPYTPDINTWGKFYKTPTENIKFIAKTFIYKYSFGHQYVKTDQTSMMEALTRSPLGADVQAWGHVDSDGIYHRSGSSNHWICIYGYERNRYWKVLDTYDNTRKKIAWDFGFSVVKEYTLNKHVVSETWWEYFLRLFRQYLGLDIGLEAPKMPPEGELPPKPIQDTPIPQKPKTTLENLCLAIRDFEGKPGDANYRNNNPGNCRYNEGGYLLMYGKVKRSPNGFAIFPTYEQGWLYLQNFLKTVIKKYPDLTLEEFIGGKGRWGGYSPASDGNPVNEYATFIANRLGVDTSYKIGNITYT